MPRMVDISGKEDMARTAVASGSIKLKPRTIEKVKNGSLKKGDVFACARIAAILAVKRTPEAIPLCHHVNIDAVDVEFITREDEITARVMVKSVGKTGVEMDALHGLSVALLTIWDMVKSEEKDETGNYPDTRIERIVVERKEKNRIS